MNTQLELQAGLTDYVDRHQSRLIQILQHLIRTPSENTPPDGEEFECQLWLSQQLAAVDLKADLYELSEVAEISSHPLFHPGRNYSRRPNLAARRSGSGNGRSVILSGHIDTVPRGTQPWTSDPFSGHIEGNRLYGRGSNDMKAGVATNLFVMECLAGLNLNLAGDVTFESVADEEFGGSNGTLAGRLRGYTADAAILSEPSSLRICPAQRGGRTVHIDFRSASGGVLDSGAFASGVMPQLTHFLGCVKDFAAQRKAQSNVHAMYRSHQDPVPVSVTKVITSPWGFREPITVPDRAQVELYWQTMPGETQEEVEAEFHTWFDAVTQPYPQRPGVTTPMRWLPGSSISEDEPLVAELSTCVERVTGSKPKVEGIEGPCDLFIFQQGFNIPSVLFGVRGGNTHAADEYVEVDSLIDAAKVLLSFVVKWCGVQEV